MCFSNKPQNPTLTLTYFLKFKRSRKSIKSSPPTQSHQVLLKYAPKPHPHLCLFSKILKCRMSSQSPSPLFIIMWFSLQPPNPKSALWCNWGQTLRVLFSVWRAWIYGAAKKEASFTIHVIYKRYLKKTFCKMLWIFYTLQERKSLGLINVVTDHRIRD